MIRQIEVLMMWAWVERHKRAYDTLLYENDVNGISFVEHTGLGIHMEAFCRYTDTDWILLFGNFFCLDWDMASIHIEGPTKYIMSIDS